MLHAACDNPRYKYACHILNLMSKSKSNTHTTTKCISHANSSPAANPSNDLFERENVHFKQLPRLCRPSNSPQISSKFTCIYPATLIKPSSHDTMATRRTAPARPSAPTLPPFPQLPLEIRLRIYDLGISRITHTLFNLPKNTKGQKTRSNGNQPRKRGRGSLYIPSKSRRYGFYSIDKVASNYSTMARIIHHVRLSQPDYPSPSSTLRNPLSYHC